MHQSGKAQKDRRTDRQMDTHSREKQIQMKNRSNPTLRNMQVLKPIKED